MGSGNKKKHKQLFRLRIGVHTFTGSTSVSNELLKPHEIRKRKLTDSTQRLNNPSRNRIDTSRQDDSQASPNVNDDHGRGDQGGGSDDDGGMANLGDMLAGHEPFEASHAGGELKEVVADLLGGYKETVQRRRRVDNRTRRDRTELRNSGFRAQMDAIVEAHMEWALASDPQAGLAVDAKPPDGIPAGSYSVKVVDVFSTSTQTIGIYEGDKFIASSLVRQGLVPCSPFCPTVAITVRVLELFRIAHLRSPRLAVQQWVKTLCDLHCVGYQSYLCEQFTVCFDLYLAVLAAVSQRVKVALGRNDPDWRLRNACPACTYKLSGEMKLKFSMLFSFDGNDSLKRVIRRKAPPDEQPEDGETVLGASKERVDTRDGRGDYIMAREKVDAWAKHVIDGLVADAQDNEWVAMDEGEQNPAEPVRDGDENPCEPRWKNMAVELTAKMWGIFEATGIFLGVCRHGFVLLMADMIKSGELSKYPLAMVQQLIEVLGEDLGGGYDIGCQFATTLDNSPLGPTAREKNYTSLVGLFHGHAHNRLCQLSKLGTYVDGMGLEDLETCERYFARSNALAGCTRYASVFHRHQSIVSYMRHNDRFDIYQALSSFLCNNYRQALEIIDSEPALAIAMKAQNIDGPEVLEGFLREERAYLQALKKEPVAETLDMEYYAKLVQLEGIQARFEAARDQWMNRDASNIHDRDFTQSIETARRITCEKRDDLLAALRDFEMKMGIAVRWTPNSPQWAAARELVTRRSYQKALDTLESLVVARMFELTKMNMSQTGYKLRKHIGKALQSRSQAIRSALDKYNAAAEVLYPDREPLKWDQVVEYAFLKDFDLLREGRQDISKRPWALPAGRLIMDQHFKIKRAREEIQRLNVEIPRVITYMRDEDLFLREKEAEVETADPALALQISIYRNERSRFTTLHMKRFTALSLTPGFTGSLEPGLRIQQPSPPPAAIPAHSDPDAMVVDEGMLGDGRGDGEPEDIASALAAVEMAIGADSDDDDDDGIEDDDEALSRTLAAILNIAAD